MIAYFMFSYFQKDYGVAVVSDTLRLYTELYDSVIGQIDACTGKHGQQY